MLEIEVGDRLDRGLPIYWSPIDALLLHQDGSVRFLKTVDIRSHRKSTTPFEPLPSMQLKGELQEEFGRAYEVQSFGSYLFVVPAGMSDAWANRFQMLNASFSRFFTTRGFPIHSPDFPLVTVLFRSVAEFQRQAMRDGASIGPTTLGYYSITSNRMVLYDRPLTEAAWFSNSTVIMHEATHQLAFNVGIHQRLSQTPLWVAEGLASLFEAEGYFDPMRAQADDKLNLARYKTWKQITSKPDRAAQLIASLVQEDRSFEAVPDESYAVAWALSYYLSERQSPKYVAYLRYLATLKPNVEYAGPQRLSDFRKYIQSDLSLLAKNVERCFDD